MSYNIYEDVFRAESGGRNRDILEVTVAIYESADCVKDQDFRTNTQQPLQQTGSGSLKTNTRATTVCLVLLCFLLLTAVIVLSVYIYTNYTQETRITILTEEREQLIINITNLTEEREQLLISIEAGNDQNQILTKEKNELLSKNDDLIIQNVQLQQVENDLQECRNKLDGWFNYQSSFYFISSEKKNWSESRRYCRDRGADLIIINNREEQDHLQKISGGAEFWIGLTDINEESRWEWVNGTNMTTGIFRFWRILEPNGRREENCAISRSSGWADFPCNGYFQWICEKNEK
ncbi:CD209 antigen-like protein C [Danio aesculapii]|uniref:CD209 antigen-like protein C n=1 Tax=Danio aesculapii TaxID=1142201 RepID=UPI0024C08AE9|nr:CD209 antigen-like protein C [Danio aesculapii]